MCITNYGGLSFSSPMPIIHFTNMSMIWKIKSPRKYNAMQYNAMQYHWSPDTKHLLKRVGWEAYTNNPSCHCYLLTCLLACLLGVLQIANMRTRFGGIGQSSRYQCRTVGGSCPRKWKDFAKANGTFCNYIRCS